jgi:hypothetical protein
MLKFNDPFAVQCIERATSVAFKRDRDQCVARFSDRGVLLGGVFFTDFNVVSVQVHIAGFTKNWIDRALLYVSVDWPYNKLGVNKMIAPVRATNQASIDFCLHFGFNIETRVKDVFPDGDLLVLSLYKSQCRFLGMRRPRITSEGSNGKVLAVP